MNIVQLQDRLKNFSQDQLVREMQKPSGNTPQFLVLGEIMRRKRMQDDFTAQNTKGSHGTVAQEAIAAAGVPQGGIADMARAMAPRTDMAQNTGVQAMYAGGPVKKMATGDKVKTDPAVIAYANMLGMSVDEYLKSLGEAGAAQVVAGAEQRATRDRMMAMEPTGDSITMPTQADLDQRFQAQRLNENLTQLFPPGYDAQPPFSDGVNQPMEYGRRISDTLAGKTNTLLPGSVIPVNGKYWGSGVPPMSPEELAVVAQREGIFNNIGEAFSAVGNVVDDYVLGPTGYALQNISALPQDAAASVATMFPGLEGAAVAATQAADARRLLGDSLYNNGLFPSTAGANGRADRDQQGAVVSPEQTAALAEFDAAGRASLEEHQKRTSSPKTAEEIAAYVAQLKGDAPPVPTAPLVAQTPGGTGGGTGGGIAGGAGSASSYEQALMDALASREKAAEQDKWLALAQVGLSLMSSRQPTLGGALGEAGLKGIEAARGARDQYDKEKLELLGALEQSRAARAKAASGGGAAKQKELPVGALGMYDAGIEALTLALTDPINPPTPDQQLKLKAQLNEALAGQARLQAVYLAQYGFSPPGASPPATSGVYSMDDVSQ
jgi:hypothetical protein